MLFDSPISLTSCVLLPALTAVLLTVSPAASDSRIAADANLYAADPPQLTPVECGRCHQRHYGDLREQGGRHRFDCLECHKVIHAYNPLRENYLELMPQCAECHSLPHGEKQAECLTCHANPHAPAQAPAMELVRDSCADCHSQPASDLSTFASKHSDQQCASCHYDRHGNIPECSDCHRPHYADQALSECSGCHPVHRPLEIVFGGGTNPQTCRDCHDEVVTKWTGTESRHGQVACADCHDRHGFKPECQSCHGTPHDERQLAMFPNCLDCHLDAHDLPVKK